MHKQVYFNRSILNGIRDVGLKLEEWVQIYHPGWQWIHIDLTHNQADIRRVNHGSN